MFAWCCLWRNGFGGVAMCTDAASAFNCTLMLPLSSVPTVGLPSELWLALCSFFRHSDCVV